MPYYLLYLPKTWLCVLLAAIVFAAVRKRLSLKAPHLMEAFLAGQESKKEVSLLVKAAKKGDVEALIKLGDAYYNGTFLASDVNKAVEEYLKAAEKGSAEACLKLGDAYSKGTYKDVIVFDNSVGTSTGWEQKKPSDAVPPQATADHGDDIKDDDEAVKWYIKAFYGDIPRGQKRLLEVEGRFQKDLLSLHKEGDVKKCEVTYGYAPNNYQVFLTAKNLAVFKEASENADVRGKKGEEFVNAVVKLGGVLRIERYRDGRLNDTQRGEPAVQVFNDKGALIGVMRYKDDRLHDGENGAPAFQASDDKGTVRRTAHYKNGQRNDSVNGEAALLLFDVRGKLAWAAQYRDDILSKTLTEQEVGQYFETTRMASSIEKAIPGIKIH